MNSTSAVFYDCEWLALSDSISRFWVGPHDPDPIVVQIGAVRMDLADDFPLVEEARIYVLPRDRRGKRLPLGAFLTDLTGITEDDLDCEGLSLPVALDRLATLAGGAKLWSWGKDEIPLIAVSCYMQGVLPPIPAKRFDNFARLALQAGMPMEDLLETGPNAVAGYFGIDTGDARAHDALDDARSIALAAQKLLRAGRLSAEDFKVGALSRAQAA